MALVWKKKKPSMVAQSKKGDEKGISEMIGEREES